MVLFPCFRKQLQISINIIRPVRSVDPRDSGDLVAMLSEEQYEDLLGSKVFERLLRAKDVHQLAILRSIVYRVQGILMLSLARRFKLTRRQPQERTNIEVSY